MLKYPLIHICQIINLWDMSSHPFVAWEAKEYPILAYIGSIFDLYPWNSLRLLAFRCLHTPPHLDEIKKVLPTAGRKSATSLRSPACFTRIGRNFFESYLSLFWGGGGSCGPCKLPRSKDPAL